MLCCCCRRCCCCCASINGPNVCRIILTSSQIAVAPLLLHSTHILDCLLFFFCFVTVNISKPCNLHTNICLLKTTNERTHRKRRRIKIQQKISSRRFACRFIHRRRWFCTRPCVNSSSLTPTRERIFEIKKNTQTHNELLHKYIVSTFTCLSSSVCGLESIRRISFARTKMPEIYCTHVHISPKRCFRLQNSTTNDEANRKKQQQQITHAEKAARCKDIVREQGICVPLVSLSSLFPLFIFFCIERPWNCEQRSYSKCAKLTLFFLTLMQDESTVKYPPFQ